MQLKTKLSEG